jgi:hypothetical protein
MMKLSTVKRLHKYYWGRYINYYKHISDINEAMHITDLKDYLVKGDVRSKCHLCQYAFEKLVSDTSCFYCPVPSANGCANGLYDVLIHELNKKSRNKNKIVSLCKQIRDVKFKEEK